MNTEQLTAKGNQMLYDEFLDSCLPVDEFAEMHAMSTEELFKSIRSIQAARFEKMNQPK